MKIMSKHSSPSTVSITSLGYILTLKAEARYFANKPTDLGIDTI